MGHKAAGCYLGEVLCSYLHSKTQPQPVRLYLNDLHDPAHPIHNCYCDQIPFHTWRGALSAALYRFAVWWSCFPGSNSSAFMCLGGRSGGGQGREVEGKITCSQECSALLWVSGGKLVANGLKSV